MFTGLLILGLSCSPDICDSVFVPPQDSVICHDEQTACPGYPEGRAQEKVMGLPVGSISCAVYHFKTICDTIKTDGYWIKFKRVGDHYECIGLIR